MLAAVIAVDWSPRVVIRAPFVTATLPPNPALPAVAENPKKLVPVPPPYPATLSASIPEELFPDVVMLPVTATVTGAD